MVDCNNNLINPNWAQHGYIQVYTGDGKGKTTASLGLAMRALGRCWKVLIVMFTKGGNDYVQAPCKRIYHGSCRSRQKCRNFWRGEK